MDQRVALGMRLMEQRVGEDFDIAEIAAGFDLSLHHFHRLFLAETGEAPAAYLRRIRMDVAAQQLCWTDRPASEIGYNVGYHSKASFTRAFAARFHETPARFRLSARQGSSRAPKPGKPSPVCIRTVGSFHVVAKRYFGELQRVRDYWADFLSVLPPALRRGGAALYPGLFHDDPRHTPAGQCRYDCCITVSSDFADVDGALARRGLHLYRTRPGEHCVVRHRGPFTEVEASYRQITEHHPRRAEIATEHPCIELHAVPRNLRDLCESGCFDAGDLLTGMQWEAGLLPGSPRVRASGRPGRDPVQVVGDGHEIEVQAVGLEAAVAHPVQSVAALENREGAFDGGADAPDQLVAHALPVGQLPLHTAAAVLDAILDAARLERGASGMLLVSLVGIDRALVAEHEVVGDLALIDLGRRQHAAADQARAVIDPDMQLVAEEQPPILAAAGSVGVGIVRRAAFDAPGRRAVARRPHRARHQRGIDQRAGLEHEAGRIELARSITSGR